MHGGDIYRNSIQFDFSVNINPMGIPSEVQWVLTEAALHANKYPDIFHENLIADTAMIFGIPESNIVYGNGASEIIMAICHAFNPKSALLIAPCFSGYESCILGSSPKCQIKYYTLSEENDFVIHHDILEKILVEKPDIMFLTNPNNPNGRLIPMDMLQEIVSTCQSVDTKLIVDECFLPLSGKDKECSLIYNISDYKSLIVLRAFTKTFAIPGVRIGYAVSSSKHMADLIKSHLPEWNLSIFAQMAGAECLKHKEYVAESVKLIETERKFLSDGLKKLGLKVYSSDANYILFKADDEALDKKLLDYSILIRDCSDYHGLEKGFYRIAVKKRNENEGLLLAMDNLLKE